MQKIKDKSKKIKVRHLPTTLKIKDKSKKIKDIHLQTRAIF